MLNKLGLKSKILIIAAAVLVIGAGSFVLIKRQATDLGSNFNLVQYLALKDSDLNQAQKSLYDQAKAKLVKNPLDKEGLMDLANLYSTKNDYQKSEEILNHVLLVVPGDTIAMQNLASNYYDTKLYKESEAMYYKIIDKGILWVPAYEALSQLYRFKLVPDNPRFVVEVQRARDSDATKQYEDEFLRMLGFYYQYKGDNSSALDYFRQYLVRVPDDQTIQGIFKELGGSEIQFK